MEKRTKLALIVLLALLLLGLGIYLVLSPVLKERMAAQPPALPDQVTPVVSGPSGSSPTGIAVTSTLPPPTAATLQGRVLEQRARSFVERIGSGASTDGFLGYTDALIDATSRGRDVLRSEQEKLRTAHPSAGTRYGISTRAVAARLIQGKIGDTEVTLEVDAVERTDAGASGGVASAQGKRYTLIFQEQKDGSYLIDGFSSVDLQL